MTRSSLTFLLAVAALLSCGGCTGSSGDDASATSESHLAKAPAATTGTLDQGPRAGESRADEALARRGEQLFQDKGCSACHAFGKRVTGPDLAGVSMRRTAAWMENQILHPDVMVKQDPISRKLFAEFMLQMPNQGLTPEEARAVIEFFKHRDHEAAEGHEAGKEDHK